MGPKLVITSSSSPPPYLLSHGRSNRLHALRTPALTAMALGIFAVQWLGLIHARLLETEHYFDLVGSLTYITVTIFAVQQASEIGLCQQIIAASS